MEFLSVAREGNIATVTLSRGKVNAINEAVVDEFGECLTELENDDRVAAIILTGRGNFFSFGFDIPEFMNFSKELFTGFLNRFAALYTRLFQFPKPVIAALNGHTIAGGCMLASACDYRIMMSGKAKISLNEIGFGSSVFAGSVSMLKFCAGEKNAQEILYSGKLYSPKEALALGLLDAISPSESFHEDVAVKAADFASKHPAAFAGIKNLLRKPVAGDMILREKNSIRQFVEIWYSESTRKSLEKIKIRS